MNVHTLSDNVVPICSAQGAITAAAITGAAVDTKGWRRAAAIVFGGPTGAGTTEIAKVQECATSGGTFTDVTNATTATITTALAAAASGGAQAGLIDLDLAKRLEFLKIVATGAGASAAGVVAAGFLLYEPANAAVAATASSLAGVHV